jgi:hypothetical protein
MKSSFGTFVLCFPAAGVLFEPVAAARAQGVGQSVCRDVLVPGRAGAIGNDERAHTEQVCNSVYYRHRHPRRQSLQSGVQQSTRRAYDLIPLRRRERRSLKPPSTDRHRVQVCARHPTE